MTKRKKTLGIRGIAGISGVTAISNPVDVEYITTAQALDLVSRSGPPITLPTLLHWIERKNLGRKVMGRWWIDKTALMRYLKGG